jgi:tetratricopeptide (TPR) repeat protein
MDKHQKKVRIQKFAALFISLMLVAVVVVSLIAPFAPSNVSNTPGEAERYVSLGQEAYAYYCRGVVYNASGATEQAIADFQKCLTLNPDEETRQEVETYLEELGVTQ